MAAEKLTLLEKAIKRTHDMSDMEYLLRIQSQVAYDLMEMAYEDKIPKDEALRAIVKSYQMTNAAGLEFEKKAVQERDKLIGFDSLTTDTSGARPVKWFEKGLAFATGEATFGVACAIVHPEIGMAASHLNAITIIDYEKFFEKALIDPSVWFNAVSGNYIANVVSPESLKSTVEQAVNLSYTKFSEMTPKGFPANGAFFAVAGLSYLNKREIIPYAEHAVNVFQNNIASEGKNIGEYKKVGIRVDWLAEPAGIVYGGPKHPDFKQPVRYNLQYV